MKGALVEAAFTILVLAALCTSRKTAKIPQLDLSSLEELAKADADPISSSEASLDSSLKARPLSTLESLTLGDADPPKVHLDDPLHRAESPTLEELSRLDSEPGKKQAAFSDGIVLSDATRIDLGELASVALKPEETPLVSLPSNPLEERPTVDLVNLHTGADLGKTNLTEYGGNKALAVLEAKVIALAMQRNATPGAKAFVTEAKGLLEDMKDAVWSDYNQTNHTLWQDYWATVNCTTHYVGDANGIHIEDYGIPHLEADHRACRRSQHLEYEEYVRLLELEEVKKQNMQVLCEYYRLNETESNWPVYSQQCSYTASDFSQYGIFKYLKFYEEQYVWWQSYTAAIAQSREHCQRATNDWKDAVRDRKQVYQNYQEYVANCTAKQDKMEDRGCLYRDDLDHCPDGYLNCFNTAVGIYNSTYEQANESERALQTQMRIILRIECLIDALVADDVAAAIEICVNKTYKEDPRVTALVFEYREPWQGACRNVFDQHVPGNNPPYALVYYANTYNLSDLCDARCCDPKTGLALSDDEYEQRPYVFRGAENFTFLAGLPSHR